MSKQYTQLLQITINQMRKSNMSYLYGHITHIFTTVRLLGPTWLKLAVVALTSDPKRSIKQAHLSGHIQKMIYKISNDCGMVSSEC